MRIPRLAAGLWLLGAWGLGSAQSLPGPDPDSTWQRQERQLQQIRERNETSADVRLTPPALADVRRLPNETPCQIIRNVRLEGFGPGPWMRSLWGDNGDDAPENRCLGGQSIQILLNRLNNALIKQGLITSQAQALSQDLRQGELVLSLAPGRVGRVEHNTPVFQPLSDGVLALQSGQILNLRDIEQTLENLRRNSSTEADINIVPGEQPGTSDLQIHLRQDRPWRVSLSLDDSGDKSTGRWQGNLTFSWDNPTGRSDHIYLSLGQDMGERAPGPRGQHSRVLHYSLPKGYWLWSATVVRGGYFQTVAGAFQPYQYRGSSSSGELQLSRVVSRSGAHKTSASLKAFARRSRNFIDDTEVEVQQRRTAGWEAGLQHTHYLSNGTLDGQISYRQGTGAFGARPAPEEAFGEGTSRMRLTQASLTLQAPMPGKPLTYRGHLRLQWNHTPLTPQDRFCLGGRYTVRGTDGTRSLCGERGFLVRHEIGGALRDWPMQAYGALDLGRVSSGAALKKHAVLAGMALGLRGQTSTGLAGTLQWDVFIGKPLHRPNSFQTARTTGGISLSTVF